MYSGVASHPAPVHTSLPSLANSITDPSRPRIHLPSLYLEKTPHPEAVAQHLSGLRTPPSDDMGTTYQAPNLPPYEGHSHATITGYPATVAQATRSRSALNDVQAALDGYSRYPHVTQASARSPLVATQQQQPLSHIPSQAHPSSHYRQPSYAPTVLPSASQQPPKAVSSQASGPGTPASSQTLGSQSSMSEKDVASLAGQSLEIPACISKRGGSLSDLAAQMTCFFWFESCKVHQLAEKMETVSPCRPTRRLTPLAIPTREFKQWVHGILKTTQVTQNVILLALLFIHRLKSGNPNVKGMGGSEFRLLTVALMLGNKFLDDNTYTNKTWAEVSCIPVKDIHVMEVEFLSNMRYSLLVSKEQWEDWLVKLSKFWEYCEMATKPMVSPIEIPSPTHFAPTAVSPTSHLLLTPTGHSIPQAASTAHYVNTPVTYGPAPHWPLPVTAKSDTRNAHGKRSFEEDPTEPPSKRIARPPPSLTAHNLGIHTQPRPAPTVEPLRLPVPNLTINTAPHMPPTAYNAGPSHAPAQMSALSLPPMVPGVRAMATVYPPTTTSTNYSGAHVAVSVPPTVTTPLTSTAPSGFPPMSNYGTPTKRHSPGSLTPAAAAALGNSSPLSESFGHGHHGIRTPMSQSPSVYLQHRASPYRPVRHVNTLLYPPPSTSLQEYHIAGPAMVTPSQMHYQPLGRRHEYRTGIVPEFTLSAQQQQHYGRQAPPPVYHQMVQPHSQPQHAAMCQASHEPNLLSHPNHAHYNH